MITLFEDAVRKVRAGVTNFAEVQRVMSYRSVREFLTVIPRVCQHQRV